MEMEMETEMKPVSQSSDPQEEEGNGAKPQFFYDSPIHSELEAKLRQLLLKLTNDNKILGIQVCAYKDGEVIIDSVAGVLGKDDPRPVQHDSLFLVFSTTKGIAAGMVHWLVDNGKLKYDDYVANIWPGFGIHKKELIKVHHVLNHTAGLHNAMPLALEDPDTLSDWKGCLNTTATSIPESEPGQEQLYHYASFGWLCGGIIEHASGMKFQDVLDEAIVRPLNIEGEFYIGIPPGVESRLATLTPDMEEFKLMQSMVDSADANRIGMPSTLQPDKIARIVPVYADVFRTLQVRQAIIPAANGHFSARALARYYATLVTGGIVPPPHSPSNTTTVSKHASKSGDHNNNNSTTDSNNGTCKKDDDGVNRIFHNPKIHEAFMGIGDYVDFALPNKEVGLGFKRYKTEEEGLTGFGHAGLGGSVGFCDIKNQFAIAVTVNKMSLGSVTALVVHLICSELDIPLPQDFEMFAGNKAHYKLN